MSHSSGTIGIVNLTDNDVEESVFSRNANRNPGDLHRSSGQFRLSRWIRKRKKAGEKKGAMEGDRRKIGDGFTNDERDRGSWIVGRRTRGSSSFALFPSFFPLRCDYFLPDTRLTYFLQQHKFHAIVVVRWYVIRN